MTDGQLIYTGPDGETLTLEDYDGDVFALRIDAADDVLPTPPHIAAALRLAVDAGPNAMLRDVEPLLQQCDREDMSPEVSHRYLTTREIRVKLGLPSKCGNIRSELGGARCSLDEHSGDTWHVDPELKIRWRNFGEGFEVRGWSPDEMEVGPVDDLDSDYTGRKAAEITAALDKAGAPNYLDADNARNVLSAHGFGIVATGDAWNRAVKVRQARVPDVQRPSVGAVSDLVELLDRASVPADLPRDAGAKFLRENAYIPPVVSYATWDAAQKYRSQRWSES